MKGANKVIVNKDYCKGCEICVEVCPQDVLIMENFIAKVVNIDNCTGCLLCEQLCPDFAIVVETPNKDKKKASA